MVMVGAMAIGLIARLILPIRPEYPSAISKTDAHMILAETCWIAISQPHPFAATSPTIAAIGPRKENVPPCTIGSLFPRTDCWISVVRPEQKNMVEIKRAS